MFQVSKNNSKHTGVHMRAHFHTHKRSVSFQACFGPAPYSMPGKLSGTEVGVGISAKEEAGEALIVHREQGCLKQKKNKSYNIIY